MRSLKLLTARAFGFLDTPCLLYGDRNETRSLFCAREAGRLIRGGAQGSWRADRSAVHSPSFLAVRGAWALQAGHRPTGRSALAPVGSGVRGSNFARAAIARCRNWRSGCGFVLLRSQVPTDRPAELTGLARSTPNHCLFWRSGPLSGRSLMSQKGTGSRSGPHRAGQGVQKLESARCEEF